jgi:hypothetical protein
MVYSASSGSAPSQVAGGPVTYRNPYFNSGCGCGTAVPSVQLAPPTPSREGFEAPAGAQVAPAAQPPMCTLTATAPPAGCCHPAPLHCSCCNGSGYFNASEAYGS